MLILLKDLNFEEDGIFELNEILDGNYLPRLFNGSWISGKQNKVFLN